MLNKIFILLIFVATTLTACGSPEPKTYPEGTLAAALAADGRFSIFLEIADEITHPHFPDTALLSDTEQIYTVFAPTDDAFLELESDLLEKLKNDSGLAEVMLFHHGFTQVVPSTDFGLLKTRPTILTIVSVPLEIDGDQFFYDGSEVIEVDIRVGDSIYHVLDSVAGVELLGD